MPCEEIRRNALLGSLIRDRLRTAFTKFCEAAVAVGARPRATLAVEAILLVEFQERPRCVDGSHLTEGVLQGLNDTHDARPPFGGMADICGITLNWRLSTAVRVSGWGFPYS